MALITCPECESKISDLAKSCPHCGYPIINRIKEWKIERKEPAKRHDHEKEKSGLSWRNFGWVVLIIVIAEMVALATCDDNNEDASRENYSQIDLNSPNNKAMYSTVHLNVRSKPNAKSKVLQTITPNQKVLSSTREENGFSQIVRIGNKSVQGWCASKYLQDSPLTDKQLADIKTKEEDAKRLSRLKRNTQVDKAEVITTAKMFVERGLKSPQSAKFPWSFDDYHVTVYGNQTYSVRGFVDSQNSFGAMLRSNFVVKFKKVSEDRFELVDIQIY